MEEGEDEYDGGEREKELAEHPVEQELDPDGELPEPDFVCDDEPESDHGGDDAGGGESPCPGTPKDACVPSGVQREVDLKKRQLADAEALARAADGAPLLVGT
eukprot:6828277-Pyramimonas_sp.AAC.1